MNSYRAEKNSIYLSESQLQEAVRIQWIYMLGSNLNRWWVYFVCGCINGVLTSRGVVGWFEGIFLLPLTETTIVVALHVFLCSASVRIGMARYRQESMARSIESSRASIAPVMPTASDEWPDYSSTEEES